MTALTTLHIRKQGEVTPFCEMPNCRTTDRAPMPSFAYSQMFLIGHSIGWYCKKHAREIQQAYDSARDFDAQELAA